MIAQASTAAISSAYGLRVLASRTSRVQQPLSGNPGSHMMTPLPCRSVQHAGVRRSRAPVAVAASTAVATTVPSQYGYLMASVAFTAAVMQWMVIKVGAARKAAGVKYPAMTSDANTLEAAVFNCTQRAHHNTLESLPVFLVIQLLIAQVYPITAAVSGVIWSVGRIVYMSGYSSGDPSKRLPGSMIANLTQLVAIIFLGWLGFSIVRV